MKLSRFKTIFFPVLLLVWIFSFTVSAQTLPSAPLIGSKSLLGVLVNFSYNPTNQPVAQAQLKSVLDRVNNYYRETSYGQFQFSRVDISPWVTVNAPSGGCPTSDILAQIPSLLLAQGIDVNTYDRVSVHFYGDTTCTWAGVGGPKYVLNHKTIEFRVAAHELGHSFALGHASGLICTDPVNYMGCNEKTYWDRWDLQGAASSAHFGARAKEYLGWLRNDSSLTTIREITQSGIYTIGTYETAGSLPRALKIRKGIRTAGNYPGEDWMYLEFRQPVGFDSALDNPTSVYNGLINRWSLAGNGHYSTLVDMTPNSILSYEGADLTDAALPVGASFTEQASGVTIRVLSMIPNQEMTIEVTFKYQLLAPVAQSDSFTTPVNTPVVLDVVANDSDANGDLLKVLGVVYVSGSDFIHTLAGPAFVAGTTNILAGEVSLTADNKLLFTPFSTFSGNAEIYYKITDGIFVQKGKATVYVGATTTTSPTKPGKGGGGGKPRR